MTETFIVSRLEHRSESDVQSLLLNPRTALSAKKRSVDGIIEALFHIQKRNSSICDEIYYGVIQFISCLYVLPVIPYQLGAAGYNKQISVQAIAISCGLGCLAGGLFANLPFVIAPPTAISIFLAIYLQQNQLDVGDGKFAVVVSGVLLTLLGWRPLGHFIAKLIPLPIQAGTAIGVGLITALAGATEVRMVVAGKFTLLEMGQLTVEIAIALAGLLIITISLHYHVKGAFCLALLFGTTVWWTYTSSWPSVLMSVPTSFSSERSDDHSYIHVDRTHLVANAALVVDLLFLYVLTLNGLAQSFSDMAGLTREDGSVPRGRWLYIVCGLTSVLSGCLGGPPILISPESAAGIKAGAKTGLSNVVCGILFLLSTFFGPVMASVPPAGTAPVLIAVGIILFQNVSRVEWHVFKDAVPAFCALFFIPFTYSVLLGVTISYTLYLSIGLLTGDLLQNILSLMSVYFPSADAVTAISSDQLVCDLHPPTPSRRPMDLPNADVVVNMGFAEMLDDPRIRMRSKSRNSVTVQADLDGDSGPHAHDLSCGPYQ